MQAFARPFPNDAFAEYASRELARKNFIDFVTYTYPEYKTEEFHIHLCNLLERVLVGDIQKLMVFAPPQHGKSEAVSVRFPPFWLAKNPNIPVMLCSYASTLANEKAGKAKSILFSDTYRMLFPELFKRAPTWSRMKWIPISTNTKIHSAGVRGAITGRGAGLGIIDDPVKSWEQAYSEGQRKAVWDWYRTTFRTRIWENGRQILIMTRWHEDDLAGRLLNQQGENWVVFRYPAIAEDQDRRDQIASQQKLPMGLPDPVGRLPNIPLAPGRFSIKELLSIKEDVGEIGWETEYQGYPQPPGGNMFKQEWITMIDIIPNAEKRVRYWDKAATAGGGARTSGVRMSYDGKFWTIEDVIKGQWSTWQREEIMKEVAEQDDEQFGQVEIWLETEGGSAGKDSSLMSIKNLAGHVVKTEHPYKGKEIRAMPLATQAEAGHVRMVRGPWNRGFISEITMFPNSTYKDQVDAASGAFNKLIRRGWSRGAGG